jgi:hypothetical protein
MREPCVHTAHCIYVVILLLVQKIEPFSFLQPARRPFSATDANEKYIRHDDEPDNGEFTILNGKLPSNEAKHLLTSIENILVQQQSNETKRSIDKSTIFGSLNKRHAADCDAARVLAVEGDASSAAATAPSYEWIHVNEDYPLAVQSLVPILDATQVSTLKLSAEEYWNKASSGTSRFTYQRIGNSEAHVCDLGQDAIKVMDGVLLESIYPLIRSAFYNDDNSSKLCVYDALLIRYNATEANNPLGAGQPLHRDLGIVSVNVMLNEQDEFEGGGTFFENQLRNGTNVHPLKPLGEGYCLTHFSSERHAGAATVAGVRDVLVVFVMARQENAVAPLLIQNARLKQSARSDCQEMCDNDNKSAILCRIQHQLMAIEAVPGDGEAFQYLGTALIDFTSVCDSQERNTILDAAIDCLRHATIFSPCDSRVYSNLGVALSRRYPNSLEHESRTVEAYQKSREILEQSREAGCDVEDEWDSVSLNYGLFLANIDRFADSVCALDRTARKKEEDSVDTTTTTSQVVDDAHRLWQFCKRKMAK